jgi:molybdenum cofactor cytidylyltransferase
MCDQPGVTVAAIERILRAFEAESAAAVVPTYGGRRGTPVLLGRALWPEAMRLTGDAGARSLLRSRPEAVRTVEVGDLADGRDADTPEEYERLLGRRDTT